MPTSFATTAVTPGGEPLYGTWTSWMPVLDFSSSPQKWWVLPLPAEA